MAYVTLVNDLSSKLQVISYKGSESSTEAQCIPLLQFQVQEQFQDKFSFAPRILAMKLLQHRAF